MLYTCTVIQFEIFNKTINEVIFNLFMNNLKKHTTIQLAIQYQFKSKDIRKWFNSLNIKNLLSQMYFQEAKMLINEDLK